MNSSEQCRVIKRNGERCQYRAKAGSAGFCGFHLSRLLPPPEHDEENSPPVDIAKVAAIVSSLANIASLLVRLIMDLMFAQTPRILVKANSILERARAIQETIRSNPDEPNSLFVAAQEFEQQFANWFTSLPYPVQLALYEWLDHPEPVSNAEEEKLRSRIKSEILGDSHVHREASGNRG